MRVLIITSVFPRSLGDDQVPWLREGCRRLKDAGVEIEVLAPSFRGLKSHTIDGIPVHRFRYAPATWETLTGEEGAPSKLRRNPLLKFLAVAYLWCGFWSLWKLLRKSKYDLIEVHWPFPHAFMALPAVWAGIPVIYHYHSAELKLAAQSFISNFFFAQSLGWARAHVANSSYTGGLVKKLRSQAKVEVIAYGSPLETKDNSKETGSIAKTEERSSLSLSRRKLLFVGRHIERKGLRYLIDAMKFLPEGYTLTIVGEGDETEALKKQAASDSRVSFTGRLTGKALGEAYLAHDIFVLPAIVDSKGDTEGLGVVLIEAIAAGLVIVASNVGGIPDVVVDERTGLLVPEKEPQLLAEAIERLGDNELLCAQLCRNAIAHAREYFSWDSVTAQTVDLYRRCMDK